MVPKLRAWLKYDKEMKNVLAFDTRGHSFLGIEGPHVTVDGWCDNFEVGKQAVLMQSTGLKDKNGVEIFEGDIVRWHDVVTWDYSVTFKDGVFCISDDPSSNFYHLKEDINGKFEVIGNIYENPELLEQANES
ncbi:YopX family protein [Enterococcus gallinarum]|uniref:YopX family protein n=1 Tax=Enterococcus gallinarum TaxID=1353 RepID=UPI003DA68264